MRKVLLATTFTLFLYPLSVEGVSVNYSFVLLPLLFILAGRTIRRPPAAVLLIVCWYAAVFVIASLYQYDLYDEGARRIISFALFMTVFSYVFTRMDEELIAAFKSAIVMISVLMSMASVYAFFSAGGAALGFDAKDLVGSQRVGFIYIVAVWLLYLHEPGSRARSLLRYVGLVAVLTGLFLTFSRSSIVALTCTFGLFMAARMVQWVRRPSFKQMGMGIVSVAAIALAVSALVFLMPIIYEFFEVRLVEFLLNPEAVSEDLVEEGSAGTRLAILARVADYVVRNPVTGSGYLGVWILGDGFAGSAHNQYGDVLFRTGVAGFAAYLYLLGIVARYLYKRERALFWGFLGILVYGFFHETFKESQGAFVLAFFVGMAIQRLSSVRTENLVVRLGRERSRAGRLPDVRPAGVSQSGLG